MQDIVDRINVGELTVADLQKLQHGTVEQMLQLLPHVIEYLVKHTSYLKELSGKFYDRYPEFKNQRELVGRLFEQVENENPGKPYEELLEKVVPRARKQLKQMESFTVRPSAEGASLDVMDDNLGAL